MIFVSREEIEREIKLQKLERELIEFEKSPIKAIKRVYKTRERKIILDLPLNKEKKVDKRKNSTVKDALIRLLRLNGAITRKELMDTTNIPWTTLFDNLEKLLRKNTIIKYLRYSKKRGRPSVVWGVA